MKSDKKNLKSLKNGMLWTYKNDNKIQAFPNSDWQRYITKPSKILPKSALQSENISYPTPLPTDLTLMEGIMNSAIARHTSEYFDAHMGEPFITVIVMLRGRYRAQTSNKTYNISNSFYFVLPAKTPVMYFAQENRFELIWFHIKNTPYWRRIFGNAPRSGKMENFANFVNLYNMYLNEIYSQNRSISYLKSLLNALLETMKKEFLRVPNKQDEQILALEKLVAQMLCNIAGDWKISTICKRLKLTPYKLNNLFNECYGMSCSKYITKIKMDKSLELLKLDNSLENIRKKLGYANAFSFSAAFKDYFGVAPKKYKLD